MTAQVSPNPHSLILADAEDQGRKDRQLFLFCGNDLPKVDRSMPRFDYTAERLFRDRRDVYDAVVKGLSTPGMSIRSIETGCHVSHHTVRQVAAREKIPIAALKRELADLAMFGARIGFETAIELMPKMTSAKDAAVAGAVMADKAMALNGDATARIEIVTTGENIFDRMARLRDDLMKVARARVIEPAALEMGLNVENAGQRGGEPGTGGSGGIGGRSDVESDAFDDVTEVMDATSTDLVTDPGDSEAIDSQADGGGRGSDSREGVGQSQMGKPSRNFMGNGGDHA